MSEQELDYASQTEGVESVKPSMGMSSDPWPTGWYPFVIKKAELAALPSGVPLVKLQLTLKEGVDLPGMRGRVAFADVFLGQGRTQKRNNEEYILPDEEFKLALQRTQEMAKGLVEKALGLTLGTSNLRTLDRIGEIYKVALWEGREFMGRVTVATRQTGEQNNRLAEWTSLSDEKKGYSAWQTGNYAGSLGKLIAGMGRGGGRGNGASASASREATV